MNTMTTNSGLIPADFSDTSWISQIAGQLYPEFAPPASTPVSSPASASPFGAGVPPVPGVPPVSGVSAVPPVSGISGVSGVPSPVASASLLDPFHISESARTVSGAQQGYKPTLVQVGHETSTSGNGSDASALTPPTPRFSTPKPPAYIGSVPVSKVRDDFPILSEIVDGHPLVWFDNAATTQRPRAVIDRLTYFYEHENSNIHRAAHTMAARATDAYEAARQKVADFIGAGAVDDIVFVRGTTEGLNLIAQSFVRPQLRPGDEIIVTHLEHHANIVPWQIIAEKTGAVIKVAPVDDLGQVLIDGYAAQFTPRTRFVSATQVSNATGTVVPIAELIAIAHGHGVPIAIDGAQSVSHLPVNVSVLDADFFIFSGHKIFGPTGIGVVYGKRDLWEAAEPYQGGGNMIVDVTFEKTVYAGPPAKFEAGTGNIADAVGLGAALDYVSHLGIENICAYEHALHSYATEQMSQIPGLRWIGEAAEKTSILSFVLAGHSTEDVGQYLARQGIAVRAGHHCAQPILRRLGVETSVRPSLAMYNTVQEIDQLVAALWNLT